MMTHISQEDRFRQAAQAEDGMPISAGARSSHLRTAMEAGRIFYVDLSRLPEAQRPALMTQIKDLVDRAIAGTETTKGLEMMSDTVSPP